MPGRRIWLLVNMDKDFRVPAFFAGPFVITGFKQFLPAGPMKHPIDGHLGKRKRSLVQIFTDPGGMRTLAVADIRFKKP